MISTLFNHFFSIYFKLFNQRLCRIKTSSYSSFKMVVSSSHEHMRFRTFNTKEPEMLTWLKNLKNIYGSDDFTFYDIGANVGIYSLYLSSFNNNCNIYSFEPESTNFSSLNKNVCINKFSNIKPVLTALSSDDGFIDLHVSILDAGAGAASLFSDYKHTTLKAIHKQPVLSAKLDTLISNKYFKFPNFIKMDVDGHELEILTGASSVFSDLRLLSVVIEFEYKSESDKNSFISMICDFGFKLSSTSLWVDSSSISDVKIQNFIFDRVQK